jgi:predicted nucleic acid-binding protein
LKKIQKNTPLSNRQLYTTFKSPLTFVASALASGANELYSEDPQAGRKIGNLQIVNPFL